MWRSARVDFAQRVKRVGGERGLALGPVVEGDGHHLPPAVVGGGQPLLRHQAAQVGGRKSARASGLHLVANDVPGGVVQSVSSIPLRVRVRRGEGLRACPQAAMAALWRLSPGRYIPKVRPHAPLGKRLPGVVLKQVDQRQVAARLQIPGARGEGRGELDFLIAHARIGWRGVLRYFFARAGSRLVLMFSTLPLCFARARVGLAGGAERARGRKEASTMARSSARSRPELVVVTYSL